MTKAIPLTKGLQVIIDDEDYERMAQVKWYARMGRENWVGARKTPEGYEKFHRVLLGAEDGQSVVARNGDYLDCRRANLVLCPTEHTRRYACRARSGYRGVTWRKKSRKYVATLVVQLDDVRKTLHIGCFTDPEEAARARDAVALEYYGDKAYLNFPLTR